MRRHVGLVVPVTHRGTLRYQSLERGPTGLLLTLPPRTCGERTIDWGPSVTVSRGHCCSSRFVRNGRVKLAGVAKKRLSNICFSALAASYSLASCAPFSSAAFNLLCSTRFGLPKKTDFAYLHMSRMRSLIYESTS
jgi:hypothetical protein